MAAILWPYYGLSLKEKRSSAVIASKDSTKERRQTSPWNFNAFRAPCVEHTVANRQVHCAPKNGANKATGNQTNLEATLGVKSTM